MVDHSILRIVPIIVVCVGVLSCAALGTKVQVLAPEAVSSIKTIAIWPVAAVPVTDETDRRFPQFVDKALKNDRQFRLDAEDLSTLAEATLGEELQSTGLFRVIRAETIARLIRARDPGYDRFPPAELYMYPNLTDADAVIVTSLSFKNQSDGINTYATLTLTHLSSGKEVAVAKFNTKWGKSYLFSEDGWTTMPDAIIGAVNGLAKALRTYPPFDSTVSTRSYP